MRARARGDPCDDSRVSRILSVGTALGPNPYPQAEITGMFSALIAPPPERLALLERLHGAAGVRTRHLALPIERYEALGGFAATNDVFLDVGVDMAERAMRDALERCGLVPADVDMVMSVTVTGLAAPSVEARLMPRLGLRPDLKRVPVFGLGCVAGAAGIARVHDYLVGHPDDVAVLLSVELCSLTLQSDDDSTPNLLATALFGDGAAAVVMAGRNRAGELGLAGPDVLGSRSRLYPETERALGWDIVDTGFRVLLAASVADIVETNLGPDVKDFLADHELELGDVRRWIAHPGGPKVITAIENALDLHGGELSVTWDSLAEVGNLSSASVLHILAATMRAAPPGSGEPAVLMAMGPGFSAELVLLRW
jgi:alkylresorcinol/alkylpyrone synthase